jgi:hypothetical protein
MAERRVGLAVCVGVASVVGLATWAVTAPLVTGGSFPLPLAGMPPQPIWPPPAGVTPPVTTAPPPGTRVGLSVRNSGTTTARLSVPGSGPIGQVLPGNTYVVEGTWNAVAGESLVASGAIADVEYRYPVFNHGTNDGMIGRGSVTLAAGQIAWPYWNSLPATNLPRLFAVQAPQGNQSVNVLKEVGTAQTTVMTVDPGDWAVVSARNVSAYGVSCPGTIGFSIYDGARTMTATSGTAYHSYVGDVDSVVVDGATPLAVTVTPNGCSIAVSWQVQGGPLMANVPVLAGVPTTFPSTSGTLARLDWTYGTGGSVTVSVTGR